MYEGIISETFKFNLSQQRHVYPSVVVVLGRLLRPRRLCHAGPGANVIQLLYSAADAATKKAVDFQWSSAFSN